MRDSELTVQEYRELAHQLSTTWNKMYGRTDLADGLADLIRLFRKEGAELYGTPEVPGCKECAVNSVFGGPGHRNSRYCRSGKRPHCTCDACF